MFLILVNSSCSNECEEIEDHEGFILIYDELSCHSCLSNAKFFTDSLVNEASQKYIIYLINPISKKKIELEFREFSPIQIIEDSEQPLKCLDEFPRVSLVVKNGSEFNLIKDFTSN